MGISKRGVLPRGRQIRPLGARLTVLLLISAAIATGTVFPIARSQAWTLADLNPWKQIRECRIFSLTRANPVGTRILIVPVIDEPINAPIYTRLSSEFANSLRSFANEVWLITDLPETPVKQGFYTALPRIIADYRLRNYLSMDLLRHMIPDFECDYIALFEVTNYDRYWIDEDLQHRVGVRAVFYDYVDGAPRLEKYWEGGRGRRLEEGAFSEAERMAVKGLVESLEKPLRASIAQREEELRIKNDEIMRLASLTATQEYAVHKTDLAEMQMKIECALTQAAQANRKVAETSKEVEFWRQQAAQSQALLMEMQEKGEEDPSELVPLPPRIELPPALPPFSVPSPEKKSVSPPQGSSPQAEAIEIPSSWSAANANEGTGIPVPRTLSPEPRDLAFRMDWDEGLEGGWEYVGPEEYPGHDGPEIIRVK